jgi:hypothetical protein
MIEKTERRGRPAEGSAEPREKWELTCYEYLNKDYQDTGRSTTFYYDILKNANGPYKTEVTYPKNYKHEIFKAEKGKAYNKQPVVMVFKTSERSNAKTKIKIWWNENVDYILTAPSLPGVPETAIIVELGVGESYIETFRNKYSL